MTSNPATSWAATLGQLQMLVTPANYETWLRDTVGLRFDEGCFVVGAQNDFATEWLHTRLRPLITRTLARTLGERVDLTFEVVADRDAPPPPALVAGDAAVAANADAIPDFLRRSSAPAPALHPALTFEHFVVGDENRLACEAARRAANEPGAVNPLTIFGASGLGKTHLLNAIGHAAYAAGRSVIYAPAERFGNDYVRALSTNKLDEFRRRYRGIDVLLIDDIQFLEGKDKFQDEFVHAFNDLHAAGKQIVIAGHAMPSQMTGLSEALRSRLEMGLVADLQKPAFPTRLAILKAKARCQAIRLPESALEQIAERCCPTVRELEGYLNRVLAYVLLVGGDATREAVEKALSPLTAPAADAGAALPDADAIIAAVCQRVGGTPGDLRGRSRTRDVTYARHLAMFLMQKDALKTVAEIGRLFGNRDHSTVLAGITRITKETKTRPETVADIAGARAEVVAEEGRRAVG